VGGCVAVGMGICSSFIKSYNDDPIKSQSESKAKIAAVEFNIAFKIEFTVSTKSRECINHGSSNLVSFEQQERRN
jgi:hypothetical protein